MVVDSVDNYNFTIDHVNVRSHSKDLTFEF